MEMKNNTKKLANFYLEVMELENDTEALEWKVVLDPQQLKQWEEGEAALALVPPELITSIFKVDGQLVKWAKQLEVPVDLLDFIARVTFKPFFKTYGEAVLEQVQLNDWIKSHCPVCGDQPTMAKLAGKEGYRKLYCGRGETEWRYRRLGCPYCKDENASKALFITMEDSKQYRIYLCERCKSYLKTIDERACGEVDLFCEDSATVELDQLAQAEGYRRGDRRQQV